MAAEHRHSRHCVKLLARLSEWIDHELDETARERIERHLADCPACHACLETLARTAALCRGLEHSALPEETIRRVMAHLDERPKKKGGALRPRLGR